MSERAVPPADITPHAFFTQWVPEQVATDPLRRARLADRDLVLVFVLEGQGGGPFTLHVEEGFVRGASGEPADGAEPDLRVEVDLPTWRELNAGRLSAPEAFLKRRVRLHGNLALAVRLHLVLG